MSGGFDISSERLLLLRHRINSAWTADDLRKMAMSLEAAARLLTD